MKLSSRTSSIIIAHTTSKSRWLSPGSRKGSEMLLVRRIRLAPRPFALHLCSTVGRLRLRLTLRH
jgi:hypothetical protein